MEQQRSSASSSSRNNISRLGALVRPSSRRRRRRSSSSINQQQQQQQQLQHCFENKQQQEHKLRVKTRCPCLDTWYALKRKHSKSDFVTPPFPSLPLPCLTFPFLPSLSPSLPPYRYYSTSLPHPTISCISCPHRYREGTRR